MPSKTPTTNVFIAPAWLGAPKGTPDRELRRRVERMLAGDWRVEDLQCLFLDQRSRHHTRASVREIGDFVAHRDQRDRGPVTQSVADLYRSVHFWVWTMHDLRGALQTLDAAGNAARANLRRATAEQLTAGCGLRREVAKGVLGQAIKKLERNSPLTTRERVTFNYLAGHFIWNPVFDNTRLYEDLEAVMLADGLIAATETTSLKPARDFIALFAVAQLHGSTIALPHGKVGLRAGYRNEAGRLEVRAHIELHDFPKPVYIPLCVFWTNLDPLSHCDGRLLTRPDAWMEPIELNREGRLAPI